MQNYSKTQKFLHDLVFNNKIINKSLFEIEKIFYLSKKKLDIENETHIFITGLPRSGTTILLNFIYSTNEFASLTYGNMPFLLSPNFSKFFNKNGIKKIERMHKDGIYYDSNSPDTFDEVFFNNEEQFVKKELLNYIKLILTSRNRFKYLSKNNLNYSRIDLIRSIFPNAIFIIPIREPLQHAYSLLTQHLNFIRLQKKNDFIRRYMNYLGHNEFGLNHRPWNNFINFKDFNNINYWLEQWFIFYKFVLDNFKSQKNIHFVVYEELKNIDYVKKILKNINLKNIENIKFDYFKTTNEKKIIDGYNLVTYNKTKLIYKEFLKQTLKD
tara:strand:+ start:385 stop:1362 length:978 start_codon:yes stop_codon:yes gene_type:complete